MRMRLIATFACFFLLINQASTQWLNGKVLSESGGRAAAVSVKFTNSANSISTNADGSFKIYAPSLPDTLVFSAEGFEPYTVVVTEKNIKDPNFEVVLLTARRAEFAEVVVTGHGKRGSAYKKSDVFTTSAPGIYGFSSAASTGYTTIARKGGIVKPDLIYTSDSLRTRARSRILTAGEVNDFKKWKRWNDYTEDEFKIHSNEFGIRPVHRYTVQITNSEGKAVVNERVFLINKSTGDTTWRAYTDNTGKAELWAGFMNNGSNEGYIISDGEGKKISRPTSFENGINFIVKNKICNTSNQVEMAFVVDATGSMGDEIEFLKLELEDVIRKATQKYENLDLHTASVFYRDIGDEYVARHVAFSNDMLKVLNFIKLQSAAGGGDTPEALDAALEMALNDLQWKETTRTRLLFLLLDAPPHKSKMEKVRSSILKAAEKGIRIIPVACSGVDKSTEFLLRSMALATNGTYTFLTDHSGVGNSHIQPTTDSYDVEKLNDLLQRVIDQYLTAQDCNGVNEQIVKTNENILSVKLFPNPTPGRFTIEANADIKELFVTDFTGKILMRLAGASKLRNWNVDLANYPSGTYLVRYVTMDDKMGSEKVVKI